ncbi:MAG: hypothetical protein AAGF45_05095 [Pseudomonadota bacterium]
MGSIAVSLAVFLTIAMGATSYGLIAARTLERAQAQLAESRYDFLLSRTVEALERNLALGLPLAELDKAPPLLEQILARAPSVLAADVLNSEGVTIFSTDRGSVGEPVPDAWLSAIDEQRGDVWRTQTPTSVTVGRALKNDFGQIAGWAAIILDRRELPAPLSLGREVLSKTLLPSIAFALVGALCAGLAHRSLTARDWTVLGAHKVGGQPADSLDEANLAAKNAAEHARAVIADAQKRMERLDARV